MFRNMEIADYLALAASFLALIVTIFNFLALRKRTYSEVISQKRIENFNDVRKLLREFIEGYLSKKLSRIELIAIKLHIEFYLNKDDDKLNQDLSETLQEFVDCPDLDINILAGAAKNILRDKWDRAKLDTTFSLRHRRKINKRIKEREIEAKKRIAQRDRKANERTAKEEVTP